MPNRILRESICTSDTVNQLTPFEETLFYRLIVKCDDYGIYDARTQVIKGACFPLRENVTLKNIENGLSKLSSVGLIDLYEYQGKPFLQLVTWGQYQTVRAKKSKYPQKNENCKSLQTPENNCKQLITNVPVIQSNPNTIRNPNTNTESMRHKYGAYNNVLLSDGDIEKLKNEFPSDYQERIERLSEYMASTGKTYKNHLATIRSWARKDPQKGLRTNEKSSSNPFLELAMEDING